MSFFYHHFLLLIVAHVIAPENSLRAHPLREPCDWRPFHIDLLRRLSLFGTRISDSSLFCHVTSGEIRFRVFPPQSSFSSFNSRVPDSELILRLVLIGRKISSLRFVFESFLSDPSDPWVWRTPASSRPRFNCASLFLPVVLIQDFPHPPLGRGDGCRSWSDLFPSYGVFTRQQWKEWLFPDPRFL